MSMWNVYEHGLHVKFIPNETRDMILLDDHFLMGHVIPKGFVFDGASVIDEDNRVRCASLLHDYYYRTTNHKYTKLQVDKIFLDAMIFLGVDKVRASAIYSAVVLAGKSSWEASRKK